MHPNDLPLSVWMDRGDWTHVTRHGVFKSDRLHRRWHTVFFEDALGNPGGERIHHLTSVRLSDRTAFYDRSELRVGL